MTRFVEHLLVFAVGLVVGGYISYKYSQKKFDEQIEKERKFFKGYKESYENQINDLNDRNKKLVTERDHANAIIAERQERVEELEENEANRAEDLRKSHEIIAANGYAGYFGVSDATVEFSEARAKLQQQRDDAARETFRKNLEDFNRRKGQELDKTVKFDGRRVKRINYEEWLKPKPKDNWGDRVFVYFDEDGVMMDDETHERVDDWERLVGDISSQTFAECEEGDIYVRNMLEESDFQIVEGKGSYELSYLNDGFPDNGNPWY